MVLPRAANLQFSRGLLLLFEDGSKAYSIDYDTSEYHAQALASLATLIETIVQMVQPFSEGQDVIDIGNLPPFITFLVYKAAAIVTESLRIGDGSKKGLRRLRTLRDFLKLLSRRWRAAGKQSNQKYLCYILITHRTILKPS